jgi:hypothetical protein
MRKFAAFTAQCRRAPEMVHEAGRIWRHPFAGAFDHLLRIYEKAILLRRDNLCAS